MNAMLLTIDQIREGLDAEFLPMEPELTGFRLVPLERPSSRLDQWATRQGLAPPKPFLDIASKYDLGNLTIGPITFGTGGDYVDDLMDYNDGDLSKGGGAHITVGTSDPYAILMDPSSGAMFIRDAETGAIDDAQIASDFESFLRGVGTVFLLRNTAPNKSALGDEVAASMGSLDAKFWRWLAS